MGDGGAWEPYEALYVHLPFCKRRCRYCDFATEAIAADDARIDEYVERLVLEIRRAGRAGLLGQVKTVYIGGGTPSYVGLSRLSMLLYTISLSMHLTPEVECTMEANPESLSANMVRDLWALGVNRLSLGVQSFDDRVLATLGRVHDAQRARDAVKMAQERFENISIDLICGIPGQTKKSFEADVRTALELGVKHVSIYPLAIEEGTPFDAMVESGEIAEPDPDAQADMMEAAAGILAAAGMHRYEVASYAYPGFESQHNQAYWTGKPYLGIGRSAVTMRQNDCCRERLRDGAVLGSCLCALRA
ncbi:MAG: radical SAM family heme chaperone HemW, partial [Coriobacteriia bacterium]|nr:radical SAM family heme chaperone HemW [Coriobacteriia bacterium]